MLHWSTLESPAFFRQWRQALRLSPLPKITAASSAAASAAGAAKAWAHALQLALARASKAAAPVDPETCWGFRSFMIGLLVRSQETKDNEKEFCVPDIIEGGFRALDIGTRTL